ncbi:MAG: hypothetical protein KBC19_03420 [Candidatus Moranbacteria bacterium]|jgi:hypothetical protein|nr:hypothetical protein [Candidatus Moranbacteria bacterium]
MNKTLGNADQEILNKEQEKPKEKSIGRTFLEIIAGLIVARAFIVLCLAIFARGEINTIEVPIWIIGVVVAYKIGLFKLDGTFGIGSKK